MTEMHDAISICSRTGSCTIEASRQTEAGFQIYLHFQRHKGMHVELVHLRLVKDKLLVLVHEKSTPWLGVELV